MFAEFMQEERSSMSLYIAFFSLRYAQMSARATNANHFSQYTGTVGHGYVLHTDTVSDWMGAEPNNDKASRSRYQQERRGNALVFE